MYTAPSWTWLIARAASTVPSRRPSVTSTIITCSPTPPRRDTEACAVSGVSSPSSCGTANQPLGRRRSRPAAVRSSTTSRAPNASTSASVNGRSTAAQNICPRKIYGLEGSNTLFSTGLPNKAAGWCTRYVSIGSSRATSTATEPWPRLPARPACWRNEATVPGKPAITTASSPPTSMPSSSALVEATPSSSPSSRRRSNSRRSSAR